MTRSDTPAIIAQRRQTVHPDSVGDPAETRCADGARAWSAWHQLHVVYSYRTTRAVKFGSQGGAVAQQNARSRRTRLALLAAARTLVEQEGVTAVTMASVAEHAGVTRRAVYLHFATRTELITALYEYVNDTVELNASQKAVGRAPDAAAALEAWAHPRPRCHPELIPVG